MAGIRLSCSHVSKVVIIKWVKKNLTAKSNWKNAHQLPVHSKLEMSDFRVIQDPEQDRNPALMQISARTEKQGFKQGESPFLMPTVA
jgi:hypothetical protein